MTKQYAVQISAYRISDTRDRWCPIGMGSISSMSVWAVDEAGALEQGRTYALKGYPADQGWHVTVSVLRLVGRPLRPFCLA